MFYKQRIVYEIPLMFQTERFKDEKYMRIIIDKPDIFRPLQEKIDADRKRGWATADEMDNSQVWTDLTVYNYRERDCCR